MREDRLAELERKVQYLTDRQEVLDCIARQARGCDRFDAEEIATAFHADGILEMGHETIAGQEYGEHANEGHGAMAKANLHHITTHLCEIDGDQAHAESYVLVLLLDKGGETSRILSGRYIDRLEKRNGEWKIVIRRSPLEVILEGPAAAHMASIYAQRGYLKGARNKSDPSYQRPLTLEGGERWTT